MEWHQALLPFALTFDVLETAADALFLSDSLSFALFWVWAAMGLAWLGVAQSACPCHVGGTAHGCGNAGH